MTTHAPHPFQTLRDLLRYAVSRFTEAELAFGHGTATAYDEAAYLLLHTLHLPIDTLDPFLDARLLPDEIERVLSVVNRRAGERVPASYITNEAWMHGRRFYVDERVIVPRSFIGELLEDALQPWVDHADDVSDVLELCTGSGCLAILTAHAFGNAVVDAVDVSTDALAVAQSNIELHGLRDRVRTLRSDLLAQVPPDRRYDLIVCNPPYVNEQSMRALPPEYRHEPRLALAGGDDGMDLVRRILADAPRFMAPEGLLVLEIGHERAHFEAAFPELDPVWLDTADTTDQILLLRRAQLAS
jgi:ribosomal protein L3 glutamine methyltransferase